MATKDYKTGERPRPRHARREGSGFFWFVTGAVMGAFGVGLAWTLQDQSPPPATPSPQATQAKPVAKPHFIFHQLLPEMEVLVPDDELSGTAASPPQPRRQREASQPTKPESRKAVTARQPPKPEPHKKATAGRPAQAGASYLVQVASLRKLSDAERLKAKLALLGVRAKIQQVTVNGKAYYRVRTGPYKGRQEVNKTRALLSRNGLEAIAIRLK